MSSIHVESCKNALEAIAEGPSHATLQQQAHYTVRTALRELDWKDRAALKGWAEAELNKIGRRRKSARLVMLQEVLNVLDASAPESDGGDDERSDGDANER
jgi:hypothetical protein